MNTIVISVRNTNIKAGHYNRLKYLITDIGKYCFILKKLDTKPGDKNLDVGSARCSNGIWW